MKDTSNGSGVDEAHTSQRKNGCLSSRQNLRRPTLADVPRLGLVATAGFYDAPRFGWERPHHHQYPLDTYQSYCDLLTSCISDPGCLVYLAEDSYVTTENESTGATIDTGDLYQVPQPNEKVPVGVAIWKLPNESSCRGLTTPGETDKDRAIAGRVNSAAQRDVDQSHRHQIHSTEAEVFSRVFGSSESLYNMMVMVVHPAYRRKGHAKSLARLGIAYADLDQQATRLIAQPNAVRLYQSVGFEILERTELKDENEHVELTVMTRLPSTRTKP